MLPVEQRRPAHRSPHVKLTPRGRFAVLGVVVVVIAVVLALGGIAIGHALKSGGTKDYVGSGTGRVVVEVKEGDSATAIGRTLATTGVVSSTSAFVRAANDNAKASTIQPGFYALRSHMSAASAVTLLLTPAAQLRSRVTVPEGTSLKRLPPLVAKETKLPAADVSAALANVPALALPTYAQGSVEGFLFPATYDVPPNGTALALLQQMVARFTTTATSLDLVGGAKTLGFTPLQVVTIASIIERESAEPQNAAKVARVFDNRLAAGLPLGSEFTVHYAGGDATSPYNTYTHKGFPPGPYDSPGAATLTAALHPADGDWLFFVTLPKEGTQFVETDAQFETLTRQCKAEGGCT